MVQHIGKPIIDFTHYITGQTKNFTGREWVFQTINDWLANPDGSRYFLLTGEPGSGKTAIASRLAQFSQEVVPPPDSLSYLTPNFLSAIHFCSARDSRWINPQVFSESLAMQLPEHYPAYAKALAEKSGDRQVRIEVHQRIEQGQSIGVVINQLDVRAVAPEDAFNRIVREPLEALFRDGFHQQIVILVDALDEALSYSGNINIVSLLAHVNELPAGVRFILTCRQDTRVENAFLGVEPFVLSEARYNQRNQEDICQYIQLRLSSDNELVARAAQIDSAYIAKLMEVVPRKAEGNFLYVRFLLDAMAKGKRALTELEGLPEGLDALYFESLERVVKLGKCDWSGEYAPLLGTLSITQESLTLAQLQSFTSHTPKKFSIWQCLGDLQQFIEEMKSQEAHIVQETKYHLYHQSVIDFLHRQLLSNNKLRNSFYLPAEECHNSLIDGCERGGLPTIWEDVKNNPSEKGRREYARRHYATHLYLAQEWDRLFAVLDEDFYRREKIRYDSHSYSQDLHLGRLASTREGLALSEGILLLPRLWQYTLLHCSLVSQASHYSLEKFEALMLLQREQEAFGLAELLTDPCSRVDTMILIAHLLRADRYRIQESLQLLTRVRDIAASIEDNKTRARALGILVHELAEMHFWEQAAEIANTIKDDEMKAKAMIDLGKALGQAQYWQQAKAILSEAEAIIHIIEDSEVRTELTAELGESFAYARQWERVKNVISTLNDSWLRANVLVEFGKALRHAQQDEQAEKVWIEAESIAQTIENSGDKAFMLGVLGCELAEALFRERAEALWTEALLVAQNIEDSWDRSQTLIDLGDLLAQAQHLNRANIVLIEAEAAVRTIEECSEGHIGIDGAKVLGELGKAWAHAKQWERAEFIANDVGGTATDRALADLSGKFRIRGEILVELGKTMAQTGLEEQATRLWLEALPTGFIEWGSDPIKG